MKVILLKNVAKVGKKGEIKNVSAGHANNYLIPNGLANIANNKNVKSVKKEAKNKEYQIKKAKKQALDLAEKLPKLHLPIKVNADSNGSLYAGVDENRLSEELKKHKYQTKPKNIKLDKHLKKLGSYTIQVKLYGGLESFFNITLIPNNK